MNIAIILSGGSGTRLGAPVPKQYLKTAEDKYIIEYSARKFVTHPMADAVCFVAAPEYRDLIGALFHEDLKRVGKPSLFADPGKTRQYSIFNALEAIDAAFASGAFPEPDNVIVHDAARPLVSSQLIVDCLRACGDFDGAMPVLPMKDAVYQSTDGSSICGLLDRGTLYCGQAPEAFRFRTYLDAHRNMAPSDLEKINGSSELAFLAGMNIRMLKGDAMNFKITDASDLERFNEIVR